MAMKYAYAQENRQEAFSLAYIGAIVSAAGYALYNSGIDEDSGDIYISLKRKYV